MDSEEQEEHSLLKNKHKILNCSEKKIVLGGPNEGEATKIFRKITDFFFFEDGFRTHHSEKSAGSDCNQHKGRGKDQEGKGKEGAYQSGFSASEGTRKEK